MRIFAINRVDIDQFCCVSACNYWIALKKRVQWLYLRDSADTNQNNKRKAIGMNTTNSWFKCAAILCVIMMNAQLQGILRGRSFLLPRSESVHAERELVGLQEEINLFTDDVSYGTASGMLIQSKSLQSKKIAGYFFGTNELVVSGSHVANRGKDDLLADYFGLPIDYKSTLHFAPSIENTVFDMVAYFGLDEWYPGMYVRLHAPLVNTVWKINMHESIGAIGEQAYPAGYMASSELSRNVLSHNATEWLSGHKTVGDIQALRYGKFQCEHSKTALSEIQIAVGSNFINDEDYHFGFNLRTAIPTGNVSHSVVFFEPMVGNGGHWELGAGMTGHTFLWDSVNGQHSLALFGDINVTHLFGSRQRRSFDFKKGGHLSRYMLIEEIGSLVAQGLQVGEVAAEQQYHGVLVPAINKTTLDAEISIAVQADAVIELVYTYEGVSAEIGYDIWARTSERVNCRQNFPSGSYAAKGDAQVYGFNITTPARFVALNATQSDATIHAGQGTPNANFSNANADNAALASFDFGTGEDELTQMSAPIVSVNGSNQAILLTDEDIDSLSAASPAALSNTFFAHIRFAWEDIDELMPFVGIGGETSFDASGAKRHSAISEWALWVKGGLSF